MTKFKDVLDRTYLTMMTDYKLDNIKKLDEKLFYEFLGGFLINSISRFRDCFIPLTYHKEEIIVNEEITNTEYVFDNELSDKELYILCLGVVINWYQKELDDLTQYRLHMNSREFKTFSESQNLAKRQDRLIMLEEKFQNEITKYSLENDNILNMIGGV